MVISYLLRTRVRFLLDSSFNSHRRCVHNEASKEREKQIRNYVLSRYMQYVQQYADVLEKRFPTAIRVYRVFTIGVKDFYGDLKVFLALFHKVNLTSKGLEALTRRELEIYHKMPKDMVRIAPVLLLSALPFANYVIFPLAYYFPRHLLTSHFWSLQQRHEFALIDHRNRLHHFKGVFRALQWQMENLKDHKLYCHWESVIGCLGSGLHPNTEEVLECKTLFAEAPYHLNCIYSSHVKELLRSHGMHTGWRRRRRLAERAKLVQLMDQAICREGGVSSLSQDEIRAACLFRGLNPANMKRADMEAWLQDWLYVSQNLTKDCRSLVLHCPILLAYNHPSNWVLR
ncbi:LETM1 domain-containing protein 1 [Macrosteles quadrilineatus]|uniref:LETM1 domain-containing protein 1 n=1 Tax=Macrosteles quadrilineatus TaxID=74068 RepID=UPI0023E3360A|nr:LETM1 domain-containing protein 1 [Macrosteles quadrilineatus]